MYGRCLGDTISCNSITNGITVLYPNICYPTVTFLFGKTVSVLISISSAFFVPIISSSNPNYPVFFFFFFPGPHTQSKKSLTGLSSEVVLLSMFFAHSPFNFCFLTSCF